MTSTKRVPPWDVPATVIMLGVSVLIAAWCFAGSLLVGINMSESFMESDMGRAYPYAVMVVSVGLIVTGDVLGLDALVRHRHAFWYPTIGVIAGFSAGLALSEAAKLF